MKVNDLLAILDIINNSMEIENASLNHHTISSSVVETASLLSQEGLLQIGEKRWRASFRQKFDIAHFALERNASVNEISKSLNWRDFEAFVGEIFTYHGYQVKMNVFLRSPRVEIDIVAKKQNVIITADCKHWKRPISRETLRRVAKSQRERTRYLTEDQKVTGKKAYPTIISLLPWERPFLDGIPIIPINKLNDFLLNFFSLCRKICYVKTKNVGDLDLL